MKRSLLKSHPLHRLGVILGFEGLEQKVEASSAS
jgi:hypothetical protein